MIYTNNQEFNIDEHVLYQMQIHIDSGTVILESSQDGLPFSVVETFTTPTVKLVAFTGATYRFVFSDIAQASLIPTKFKA